MYKVLGPIAVKLPFVCIFHNDNETTYKIDYNRYGEATGKG